MTLSAFTTPVQVLVDADNVFPSRLQPVLDALGTLSRPLNLTAAGHARALERVRWPAPSAAFQVELIAAAGWQSADIVLAQAYSPNSAPLVLVTGDGDFALLAGRHSGPVLVISGAPSVRLRDVATVIDPALVGVEPIMQWIASI